MSQRVFSQQEISALFESATAARENAHAPYSRCLVGAAVRSVSGKIFAGCNVENASYGATLCAERVAIGAAVCAEGTPRIVAVMVVTDADEPWPPCGLCRQVIAEFADDCVVFCANLRGEMNSTPFAKLFPAAFTPDHLGHR